MGLFHEPIQTASPIEQRILGVQMQVNKVGMRHTTTKYRLQLAGSKEEMLTGEHYKG
jgi:hypothetical protein